MNATMSYQNGDSRTSSNASSSIYVYPSNTITSDTTPDRRMSSANENSSSNMAILLRKLPRNTTAEAVRTMLVFAKDLKDTEIISDESEEEAGFSTAIARFSSVSGAAEAQAMLDGKPNMTGHANLIVEIIATSPFAGGIRRNTIDHNSARSIGHPLSPSSSNGQKSSRFNGTFQSMDKTSPPIGSLSGQSPPEHTPHLPPFFSPQSPAGKVPRDRSKISGKSVISEEGGEDETGELLKDPLGYLNNNNRRGGPGRPPVAGFSALSLNTSTYPDSSSPGSGYTSPRSGIQPFSPHSPFSPGPNQKGSYAGAGHQYIRHNYPPVNPADQNPPCNTLYVGNLPIDTSEDELKAIFSKQRGYKRLCFRTKQNGPMCFVEFEDISFATKALNELYGAELHNSVKGGIRLSFSKNPLGVRAGQPGSSSPSAPMNPVSPSNDGGHRGMNPVGFSTANGPPPGLSMPPGLNMYNDGMGGPIPKRNAGLQYVPAGFNGEGPNIHGMNVPRGMRVPMNGNSPGPGMYPDYMMGR